MNGKINLRALESTDLAAVRRLNAVALPIPVAEHVYTDALSSLCSFVAINEESGIVGAILVEPEENETCVRTLAVDIRYRGSGIGKRLLELAVDKKENVYLHVQIDNLDAIALYEKMGFQKHERINNYYRRVACKDCYIMKKVSKGMNKQKKKRFFNQLNELFMPPKRKRTMEEASLEGKEVLVVPIGVDMSRKRVDIWTKQIEKVGGNMIDAVKDENTIVIASTSLKKERLLEYCKVKEMPLNVYTPEWLIYVLKNGKPPSLDAYRWIDPDLDENDAGIEKEDSVHVEKVQKLNESEEKEYSEALASSSTTLYGKTPTRSIEGELARRKELFYLNNPGIKAIHEEENQSKRQPKHDSFVCTTTSVLTVNQNTHITNVLEELIAFLAVEKDEWRENSYKRIVSILKQLPYKVNSTDDIKPQFGLNTNGIAKIREILETGSLRKLEAKRSDPTLSVLREFSNIWGVGPATAKSLYGQGFRSLKQLKEKEATILTEQQRIGLAYYDDFLMKIPREEVEEIEAIVKEQVKQLNPRAIAITCGSYRRGKTQSGDVDILITDPGADECFLLPDLLKQLHTASFLTDDLTHVYEHHLGGCDSYMGVCRVNQSRPHRRIDLKVYPRNVFGFALLYFTGSDHFNRSMRAYAKQKGYSLTDRGLTKVARAKGIKKLKQASSLICPDEMDVFIALQLPYKLEWLLLCYNSISVQLEFMAPHHVYELGYERTLLDVHWVPNTASSLCCLCFASFGLVSKRRHHCRLCGQLVCSSCSRHRSLLKGSRQLFRTCTDCASILSCLALNGDSRVKRHRTQVFPSIKRLPIQTTLTQRSNCDAPDVELRRVLFANTSTLNGATYYVVSSAWYNAWLAYVQAPRSSVLSAMAKPPGPISNYSLLYFYNGRLYPHADLNRGEDGDYRFVNEEAWRMLTSIYGGGPCISLQWDGETEPSPSSWRIYFPPPPRMERPMKTVSLHGLRNNGTALMARSHPVLVHKDSNEIERTSLSQASMSLSQPCSRPSISEERQRAAMQAVAAFAKAATQARREAEGVTYRKSLVSLADVEMRISDSPY
ncbi:DNA polymerase lambda [Thraustotheca clavata]|uniref:DNA polymerase lambda n=1 Tax=Thraustotheca clavata TaxID=74557 RepID=A0A1W0A2S9_9STRA|nr:DNA polymerase lambda [Thraustotheca clavata]